MNLRMCELLLVAIVTGVVKHDNVNNGIETTWLYPASPVFIASFIGLQRFEPTKPAVRIDFGHEVIYNNFIPICVCPSEKQLDKLSNVKVVNTDRLLLTLSLLMCGDVHPCPGPSQVNSSNSNSHNSEGHSSQFECFKQKGLHFIHINVRSLIPKVDELRLIARNSNAAVIGVSETWLDSTVMDSEIKIDNYVLSRGGRNRNGGGVCANVRADIAFKTRLDLRCDDLQSVWIELLLPKTKPILTGVVYRPPNQMNFYDLLENVISSCDRFFDIESIILGDFNTNVSGSTDSSLVQHLKQYMLLFYLNQIISDPTRTTINSSTTIDLILTSDKHKLCNSGVIDNGLRDHLLVFCTRKVVKGAINKHNSVKVRSLKNYNLSVLKDKLLNVNWVSILACESVDMAWNMFKGYFLGVVDELAPVKEIRIKQRTEP